MEIYPLPQRAAITYFEVQYFHNDAGRRGKAQHVLCVTYSTERNRYLAKTLRSVQKREYFTLYTGYTINEKTKLHLGDEMSAFIKAKVKLLKSTDGITTWFGFRQVQEKTPPRDPKGRAYHKRQVDSANQVFAFIEHDGTFTVKFNWEGECIEVVISPHSGELATGQSVGVGYYTSASSDLALAESIAKLRNAPCSQSTSVELGTQQTENFEQGLTGDDNGIVPIPIPLDRLTKNASRNTALRREKRERDEFEELCNTFLAAQEPSVLELGTKIDLFP